MREVFFDFLPSHYLGITFSAEALTSLHKRQPFQFPEGMGFSACAAFLGLKVRQMTAKLRDLSRDARGWEGVAS